MNIFKLAIIPTTILAAALSFGMPLHTDHKYFWVKNSLPTPMTITYLGNSNSHSAARGGLKHDGNKASPGEVFNFKAGEISRSFAVIFGKKMDAAGQLEFQSSGHDCIMSYVAKEYGMVSYPSSGCANYVEALNNSPEQSAMFTVH